MKAGERVAFKELEVGMIVVGSGCYEVPSDLGGFKIGNLIKDVSGTGVANGQTKFDVCSFNQNGTVVNNLTNRRCSCESDLKSLKLLFDFTTSKEIMARKNVKVDPKVLDKIILAPDKKQQILSVLIQHEKRDKLFTEWGLGEIIEYGRGMTMLFWGPPGCLAGDTVVEVNRAGKSFKIKLEDLVYKFNGGGTIRGKTGIIEVWDDTIPTNIRAHVDGHIKLIPLIRALNSGIKETFEVKTKSGRKVRATHDHPFLTSTGWKKLEELKPGDLIVCEGGYSTKGRGKKIIYRTIDGLKAHPFNGDGEKYRVPYHRLVAEARDNFLSTENFIKKVKAGEIKRLAFLDPKKFVVHHKDHNPKNNSRRNLLVMTIAEHRKLHAKTNWKNVTIKAGLDAVVQVTPKGKEDTYDLTVDYKDPNFLANGLIVHNTGKTFCAKAIATALGKELINVDNGLIQSPMPGEFERNLQKVFDDAKKTDAVIFIDECDGMIQSRQGMGQIMSGENNKLLTLIEQFEGILIMSTNRIGRLDEALNRRLALILEFCNPTAEERKAIWDKHLPKKLPLAEKKDDLIAHVATFSLSGGEIKNAVISAARTALYEEKEAVERAHFETAISTIVESKKKFANKKEPVAYYAGGEQIVRTG